MADFTSTRWKKIRPPRCGGGGKKTLPAIGKCASHLRYFEFRLKTIINHEHGMRPARSGDSPVLNPLRRNGKRWPLASSSRVSRTKKIGQWNLIVWIWGCLAAKQDILGDRISYSFWGTGVLGLSVVVVVVLVACCKANRGVYAKFATFMAKGATNLICRIFFTTFLQPDISVFI